MPSPHLTPGSPPPNPFAPFPCVRILFLSCGILLAGCGGDSRVHPTAPALTADAPADSGNQSASIDLGAVDNLVVVALAPGVSAQDLATQFGATVGRQTDTGYATLQPLLGPASALATALRLDPRVRAVDVDGYVIPAEERQQSQAFDKGNGSPVLYQGQPSVDDVGLALAHRTGTGRGALIAVLDTGAELTHPALAGHIVASADFAGTSVDGHEQGDGVDNDGDGLIDEALGHGTHVSGIAALVAPSAGLLIGRVLDADGRGDILSVASGIAWATAHGAHVINMSFGMLQTSTVIEYALAQADSLGAVCVAAAGNDGAGGPVEYPASSSHVLAIAALDDADHAASFTSSGAAIALSAPGVSIRSSYTSATYALWSGTSMAAPFVSGTAGLLRGLHPVVDVARRRRARCRSSARSRCAMARARGTSGPRRGRLLVRRSQGAAHETVVAGQARLRLGGIDTGQ